MIKISYTLDDILSLLICAEVYGFGNDIFYKTMINPIEINQSHIDEYISKMYPSDKFSEEDIGQYKKILVELIKIYK